MVKIKKKGTKAKTKQKGKMKGNEGSYMNFQANNTLEAPPHAEERHMPS